MPLPFRTSTLGAAHCSGGIRIYSRTPDGFVRELCNDTTEAQLNDALQAKNLDVVNHYNGWYPGELMFQSSPDSALCSYAWAAWSQSVLYQDAAGALREWRHGNRWDQTSFVQENCMVGTNIAAVYSTGGAQAVLFFQDSDGHVCSRSANHWTWGSARRIAKAVRGTGIGATATDDLKDIRLYFQNEDKELCEYKGSFGTDLKHDLNGLSRAFKYEIGDITAISWDNNAQIRVYMQDNENTIIEHVCDGGKWLSGLGNFKHNGLPDTDIIAYVRNAGSKQGFCVIVIWTGSDQELYQSVWSPAQGSWSNPKSIASLRGVGEMAGSWTGNKHFKEAQDDSRSIRAIRICTVNKIVAGVQVEYFGIKEPQWHGLRDAKSTIDELKLSDDEDVVDVWYAEDPDRKRVTGLRFRTTANKISPWYGSTGRDSSVWTRGGHALAGFQGCCAGDILTGLAPIWSTRMRGLTESQIASLAKTRDSLTAAAKTAQEAYRTLHSQLLNGPDEATKIVGAQISDAMDALVVMAQHVECLYDLSKPRLKGLAVRRAYMDAEVAACRQSAQALAAAFTKVSSICHDTIEPRFNKLLNGIKDCGNVTSIANQDLHKFYAAILVTAKSLGATKNLISTRDLFNAEKQSEHARTQLDGAYKEMQQANSDGDGNRITTAEAAQTLATENEKNAKARLNSSIETIDALKLAASGGAASAAETQAAIDELKKVGDATKVFLTELVGGLDAVGHAATALAADTALVTPKQFAGALRGVVAKAKAVELLPTLLAPGDEGPDFALVEATVEQIASA